MEETTSSLSSPPPPPPLPPPSNLPSPPHLPLLITAAELHSLLVDDEISMEGGSSSEAAKSFDERARIVEVNFGKTGLSDYNK